MIVIVLTNGKTCVVSAEDADLASFNWRADANSYAAHEVRQKNQILHRVVLSRVLGRELVAGEIVDHIDGDVSNNCRSNLQEASEAYETKAEELHGEFYRPPQY